MKAVRVTSHTLIGVHGEPPHEHGNCFSVIADNGEGYRIVNFNYENLEALGALGLKMPIEIEAIGNGTAVVMDGRIGERWYQQHFCEVCCPPGLLPVTQRHRQQRDILRGRRSEDQGTVTIRYDLPPPEFA